MNISLMGQLLEVGSLFLLTYTFFTSLIYLKKKDFQILKSSIRSFKAAFLYSLIAIILLIIALVNSDFSLEYVASYTSRELPLFYKITALWAGQAGSLLFWLFLQLTYSTIFLKKLTDNKRELAPYFLLITSISSIFFNFLILAFTDPFAPLNVSIPDGRGMNPLLQNIGMVFHPPTLYLGYVGFIVPFAYGFSYLLGKEEEANWIKETRKWTMISWIFLTIGIILGMQWAYVELGWGGYWGWDPVENASLIPWLIATAFLHTQILENKKGIFKKWNLIYILFTFILCVFGTFITRSGFIESVHAFTKSRIGYYFLFFMIGYILLAVLILFLNKRKVESSGTLKEFFSKESFLVYVNVVLTGLAAVVLWGTVYPTVSLAFFNKKISIKEAFFNKASIPFAILILVLLGICQIFDYSLKKRSKNIKTTGVLFLLSLFISLIFFKLSGNIKFLLLSLSTTFGALSLLYFFLKEIKRQKIKFFTKNKRASGAFLIHMGVIFLLVGIIGSSFFSKKKEFLVKKGETFKMGKYEFKFQNFKMFQSGELDIIQADVKIYKNGKYITTLHPQKQFHRTFQQPISEVAIHMTPSKDIYIIYAPLDIKGKADFQVIFNPLIFWMWLGGIFMVLGGILSLLEKEKRGVKENG